MASSSTTENDPHTVGFVSRVSKLPLVKTVLQVYEQMKASSKIIKYVAEILESSIGIISRPVVSRLPVAQLDGFFCRQLDRFGRYGGPAPTPATATPNQEDPDNPPDVLYPPLHLPGSELDPPQTPWHGFGYARSSGCDPGSMERPQIVGGFIIPYDQCWKWLERTYNIKLNSDHSEDLTATSCLEEAIQELGYDWEMEFAQNHDHQNHDLLLVTQRIHGRFMNNGPEGVEEVIQNDLKGILKRGKQEDVARRVLLQDFQIKVAAEFKCFFYPL